MKTLEEKRNALLTLIEGSILLSYGQKLDIIDTFPSLTEEQIDALGKFLATEEQARELFADDIKKGTEQVLSDIVGEDITKASDNAVFVGSGKAS